MALLEVKNLAIHIKHGEKRLEAVKGIDFCIDEGEIVALAGESGSGKTLTGLSLLQLLPDAAEINGGTITFDSRVLNTSGEKELRAIRGKDISMIFQELRQSLNPLLRCGPQITETPELHGEKNKKTSQKAALEMLALMGFIDPEKIFRSYPHQLSPGMCQRVMIAIAAICGPKLLVADEPVNSLDSDTQRQVLDLLVRMNRERNTAILYITHDLDGIRNFCSRIMIMYCGKIMEEGPAEMVLSAPAHPYTQGLLNAMPSGIRRGSRLPDMAGRSPPIEEQISGCPFAGRCSKVQERCRVSFPQKTDLGDSHAAYCYNIGKPNV